MRGRTSHRHIVVQANIGQVHQAETIDMQGNCPLWRRRSLVLSVFLFGSSDGKRVVYGRSCPSTVGRSIVD